jgi:hypothetical protein
LNILCEHQRPDGGFSTYTSDLSYGAWVDSHPDVSASALLALLSTTYMLSDRIARGVHYLRSVQRSDGLWNSFWWTSCLYATEFTLTFLQAARERFNKAQLMGSIRAVPTPSAFESALLLSCMARIGGIGDSLVTEVTRALVLQQLFDGSWPSAPTLRLSDRNIGEPWNAADPGRVYCDQKRLFTTASVVSALAVVENDCEHERTSEQYM